METKTVEQEIQELTGHEIPFGQKLVLAGFKTVTLSQLEKRFALDKIREKIPSDEQEAREHAVKSLGFDIKDCAFGEEHHWKAIGSYCIYVRHLKKRMLGWIKTTYRVSSSFQYPKEITVVKVAFDPFDKYVGDKIPDYVYSNIAKAESFGLSRDRMMVAYPCVGTEKRPDPVLVYPYPTDADSKGMLEISMWE